MEEEGTLEGERVVPVNRTLAPLAGFRTEWRMESVSRGSGERETRIPGAVSVVEGDGEAGALLIGVGVVVVVAIFNLGGGA